MKFDCRGYLYVSVKKRVVHITVKHHLRHLQYKDVALPDDVKELIDEMKLNTVTEVSDSPSFAMLLIQICRHQLTHHKRSNSRYGQPSSRKPRIARSLASVFIIIGEVSISAGGGFMMMR